MSVRFTTSEPCEVHRYHSPRPQYQEVHHVQPLSWGGPDEAYNRVAVCPTGHRNIHRLLDALRATAEGRATPPKQNEWGEGERDIAHRGFEAWFDAGGGPPPGEPLEEDRT